MYQEIERRLNRREASEFLTQRGFRIAPATLAKLAVIGGGPSFVSFGRRPLYEAADLLAWVESRTSRPKRHTSETSSNAA